MSSRTGGGLPNPYAGPNARRLAGLERRDALGRLALTLPAVALVALALFLPLAWLVWQSFLNPDGLTLEHYRVVIERPAYLRFLSTTIQLSFLATAICIALAYPLCCAMVALRPMFASFLFVCVICSFFASYLVRTYAWLLLLQRRGLLNSFLIERGWIEQPLQLVYNMEGTVIGMVHILLPMMVLPLYAAMKSVDGNLVKAAMGLGASPSRAFRDVFLPLSLPGLAAGSLLVFILSLGFYLTPAILGGGRIVVWATAIATAAEENPVWGAASALGIILLAGTFGLLYILKRLLRIDSVLRRAG